MSSEHISFFPAKWSQGGQGLNAGISLNQWGDFEQLALPLNVFAHVEGENNDPETQHGCREDSLVCGKQRAQHVVWNGGGVMEFKTRQL